MCPPWVALCCLASLLAPAVATDEHSFLYPGREFVTAFLQDCQQNPMAVSKLLLIIRAVECCSNANVWVSVPNTPFQNRHQVNQWTVTSVEIPSSAMLLGTSNSTNQTVFITSDRGITVQSISSSSLGFDSSIVYPLGYLGQDYYMLTPISRPGDASYEFAIVNINTSNMVNVTLKGDVVYEQERYPAGSVLNLTLAPFQSIQFQSSMDLTGSRVMAAQPVAVLSGHQCGQRYADLSKGHVYEQLPPVSKWGTTFIVPPLSAQKDEGLVYVVASRATNIEIYTSPSLRSNSSLVAGGALTLGMVPASLYITADHPILVLFYSMGSLLNESPHFTPFIICIIPTEQFVSSYTAYRLSDSINRIVIVAPTSGGSAYTINYNSLQVPAQWKATSEPDPMYRWADVSNSNQYYGQSGNVVYENSRQKFGLYAYTFKDCTEVLSYPFAGIMFVTVFMESWENTERRLELFLHALACCTTVSVSVIGTTFHVYVRLQVGEDARVQIPSSAMLSGTCRSSNSTVIITSNQPITVLSSSSTAMDQDTSVVYPNDFLHTEYHIITPSSNLPLLHEFAIVNLYYRNTVSITIKSYALFDGVEYAGGQTLTVHLSPLQSLQLQSNSSLTGSTVIALNPVAVLSGHQCAQEYPNFSYGFVYEQLPPVFQWGNSFIVPPLSNRSDGDVIYITGSGHTRVQVFNGSSSAVHHSLNEGEALTLYMDANPLYITGNRDLMILFHCSGSLQSSLPLFAPFVFTIMPTKQFSSYHFLQGPCHLSNRMVIVAHHNYRSDIELDNTLLSVLAQWNSTSAASSGHVWTDVTFQQGPHTVHHSSERRIMVYPYSFTESGTPLLSECSSNDSYLGLYGTHQPWACSPPDTMYTCCCEYNYKASTLRTSGYGNISTLSPNNPALNPSSSNGNGVPSGGGAGATSAASPTSNPSSSNSNGVPSGGGAGATTAASPTSNPSSSNSNGVPSGGGAGTSSVASPTSNPSSSNSNGVPSGGGAGTSSVASPASTHTSHHSSPLNNASTGATVASRPAANYSTGPVYLVKKNLSWWDALAHCRSNHSDLASIATPQVQKAAAEIARSAEGEGVWIGLRRHRVWGNLYWIDKNHSQMYTNWGDGEPSDPSSELCVLMTRDAAKNFTWADHCCHVRLNFLCSTDGASTNGG